MTARVNYRRADAAASARREGGRTTTPVETNYMSVCTWKARNPNASHINVEPFFNRTLFAKKRTN